MSDAVNVRTIVLLYTTSFMLLGLSFPGSGVTSVLISFLTSFAPLDLVLHLSTRPRTLREAPSAPPRARLAAP